MAFSEVLLASAARTATVTSRDISNPGFKFLDVVLDVGQTASCLDVGRRGHVRPDLIAVGADRGNGCPAQKQNVLTAGRVLEVDRDRH